MNIESLSNKNTYNISKIRKIVNSVYKNLDYNKSTLEEAIEKDDEDGNTIELDEIKAIVKKYLEYKEIVTDEDIKSQKVDGIGNVAVVYDGRPEIMVEMAIKALFTNNNMVFFPILNMATTQCIHTIFSETMKEIGYTGCIDYGKKDELFENKDYFNLAVFIGDKFEYYKFKKKFEKDIIYSSFGFIQIFSDDEFFDKEIDKINDYVFNNNYVAMFYDDEDVKEVIKQINDIAITDMVVIFTKKSKKAVELIKNIKAHKIYVNKYPFDKYKFEFDEKKLLIKKQIIT